MKPFRWLSLVAAYLSILKNSVKIEVMLFPVVSDAPGNMRKFV
jgi:hypothetical protein